MSPVSQDRRTATRRQDRALPDARIRWSVIGRWASLVLVLTLGAAGSFYVFDRFLLAKIPTALVGKWGVDGGVQDGATLELNRNGTYRATVNLHGSEGIVTGRLEASAKSLTFISVHSTTGEEKSLRKTVVQIGKEEMTLREPSGEIMKLVRLD
jgi:hypothetical protein